MLRILNKNKSNIYQSVYTLIRELSMDYITLKLPSPIGDKIDAFIDRNPEYHSRADVVKMIIRDYLNNDGGSKNYQKDEKV